MTSQRVAPMPNAAYRSSGGVVANTSRTIAVMIGRIMSERTTPPANMLRTVGGPANRGTTSPAEPASSSMTGKMTTGTKNTTAHRPITTLGIIASRSTV